MKDIFLSEVEIKACKIVASDNVSLQKKIVSKMIQSKTALLLQEFAQDSNKYSYSNKQR